MRSVVVSDIRGNDTNSMQVAIYTLQVGQLRPIRNSQSRAALASRQAHTYQSPIPKTTTHNYTSYHQPTSHLDGFHTTTTVKMKLNISYPANGTQKLIEIEDERKLRIFMDRRMGAEIPGDNLGPEFKGYVFKITGGNDKQGFPMKQGIMHPTRVRLLLSDGHSCYRPRRTGERKRKSVRGCIVGMDLSVLALSIVKQGEEELPGLTDTVHPKRLGPKRATKIRRFFGLSKDDDVRFFDLYLMVVPGCKCLYDGGMQVRKFVIRREVQPKKEGGKPYTKAPRIQRLVTPQRLQHKRHLMAVKRRRAEASKDAAVHYLHFNLNEDTKDRS